MPEEIKEYTYVIASDEYYLDVSWEEGSKTVRISNNGFEGANVEIRDIADLIKSLETVQKRIEEVQNA